MADYIKVDAKRMGNNIDDLHELLKVIPVQISDLEDSLGKLSTMWEGEAWSAFQIQISKDIEYLNELYQLGLGYVKNFTEAKNIYQDAEIKVDDEVNSLKLFIF